MKERTDYTAAAERIDYAKLEKKLEQLQGEAPPKKRKSAGDVLAPVREKLLGPIRRGHGLTLDSSGSSGQEQAWRGRGASNSRGPVTT